METTTSQDGTTIAFDRHGDGPPVVLVGGAFQHRAIDQSTAALAARLAERHTVIHFDRRGRGDSGDTPPYAVEREIEDVAAIVAAAGGEAQVFGMSSGAALALEAAAAGVPITRLALYEIPLRPGAGGPSSAELAAMDPGDAVAAFLTTGPGMTEEQVTAMRAQPFWAAMASVGHTLAYDTAIIERIVGEDAIDTARWSAVAAPVLVMAGGASDRWWHDAAHAVAGALPHAELRVLDGQTHQVDVEVLGGALQEWFREADG